MALVALISATQMIQQRLVNGQTCYIDNLTNNATDRFKNCDNPPCIKSITFNVTKLVNIPDEMINLTQFVDSVDLSNTSLQFLNSTLHLCQWPKLTSIEADDNNITELQANILSDCHHLLRLSLVNSNISQIYEPAFTGLNMLIELDLSSNQLTMMSAETFKPLINLETLRLNNNRIQTINADNFATNAKLHLLDLSYNAISVVRPNAFRNLTELLTLAIQCNPDLASLDLNDMGKLNLLSVNNASLTQLDIPKNLVHVNADNNKISNVSIESNSMLGDLSLKNNSFQKLANLSLAQKLMELDVSSNNISDIDFTLLMKTNVSTITMLENPIRTFNVSALIDLPKIKQIEISTSRLDNSTLTELIEKTKAKGITLSDPNRLSEKLEIITLSPIKPVDGRTISTPRPPSHPASVATSTVPPNPVTSAPSKSDSADKEIKELWKHIQSLESSSANQTNSKSTQKESMNAHHSEIENSLSSLRLMVNCMMAAMVVFIAFKLVLFFRANQWSIPISSVFSRPSNGHNSRRNPFNDSMDPIIEEIL